MSSSGSIDIQTTLPRISSSSATERKEGLADLLYLLNYNKNSHVLEDLKDKKWHSIFEALFTCSALELQAYNKATQSQKSTAASDGRLSACGKALRAAVSAGVQAIRAKTVKAVVDHILQTLPTKDKSYCQPLALEYLKSLNTILKFQPHVEHMRDLWQDVLDFCIQGLAPSNETEQEADSSSATLRASNARASTVSLARRSRAETPQTTRTKRQAVFRPEVDELVTCISSLVRPSSAPILGNELDIIDALRKFLLLTGSYRRTHNEAWVGINAVLERTTVSSVEMMQTLICMLIPTIKEMWAISRSLSLKDEMLVSLILMKDHIVSAIKLPTQASLRTDAENLLEALQMDYNKRLIKSQVQGHLQIADLVLDCSAVSYGMSRLRAPTLSLRKSSLEAESHWALVDMIAHITAALDERRQGLRNSSGANGLDPQAKRPRVDLHYQDILRSAISSPTLSTRIASLQYLTFYIFKYRLDEVQLREIVSALVPAFSDVNIIIANWTILAVASCAQQRKSEAKVLSDMWLNCFNLVIRLLTARDTSRCAAHLALILLRSNVIAYGVVAQVLEDIFNSLELQGPAVIADATVAFVSYIMDAYVNENPSTSSAAADRSIRWLLQKWDPVPSDDKADSAQHALLATSCRPYDIATFLAVCQSQEFNLPKSQPLDLCGKIAQAWLATDASRNLMDFTLMLASSDFLNPLHVPSLAKDVSVPRVPLSITVAILDGLGLITQRAQAAWDEIHAERTSSLLPDAISNVSTLILVNVSIVSMADERIQKRVDVLTKQTENLVRCLTNFLSGRDCELDRLDAALNVFSDYLPRFHELVQLQHVPRNTGLLLTIGVRFADALEVRQQAKTSVLLTQDMEVDGFESQHSEVGSAEVEITPRNAIAVMSNQNSFRQRFSTHCRLLATVLQSSVDSGEATGGLLSVPSAFISHLIALEPTHFLSCRALIAEVISAGVRLDSNDAEILFEHLSEYLKFYEYSRHEVALLTHIDVLRNLSLTWTSPNDDDDVLSQTGSDAYRWFIQKALPLDLCSTVVKIALVDLLFTLLSTKGPEFKPDPTIESVRTVLFSLLGRSELPVVYTIIQGIGSLFEHYTLDVHEKSFNELYKSSLFVETWQEGNALRILLFSALGSRWHTLLRRCVYHIFEAAGAIVSLQPYASRCIADMSRALHLPTPQSLFKLFSSQLLYTWASHEHEQWDEVPFRIFGFSNLREMLNEAKDDIYAQLLMNNKKDDMTLIASKLGVRQSDLASSGFGKAAAYSIAMDTEAKRNDKEKSETTLRALIGSTQYKSKYQMHYPSMLGLILLRTNFETSGIRKDTEVEEDPFARLLNSRISNEKASNRDAQFEIETLSAYKSIKAISSSGLQLPDPQQPIFRSKFFFDTMDRLARRLGTTCSGLWRAKAPYTFVLRLLLSSIHPALGSLHSCFIIRKIRILIALVGPAALEGYPLEAALHGLRPFLTDKQCADDTLGIVQYLYANGVDHFTQSMNFALSMNVIILISLRRFVGSTQESTTQESQHIATVNKANAFRKWLVESWSRKFAESRPEGNDKWKMESYKSMVSYAYGANSRASSVASTHEAYLLLLLLDDRRARRCLLEGSTWDLAMKLFCQDFEVAPSYRTDLISQGSQAAKYSSEIVSVSRKQPQNSAFYQWASRILGRASRTPNFDLNPLQGSDTSSNVATAEAGQDQSAYGILTYVQDVLTSGNGDDTGLAEECLRAILNHAHEPDQFAYIQEHVSPVIEGALRLPTADFVVQLQESTTASLADCFDASKVPEVGVWLRQFAISIVTSSAHVPIISSLRRLLEGVTGAAEELLSFILHLALKEDIKSAGKLRNSLSSNLRQWFASPSESTRLHIKLLLKTLLYLRQQPYPQETTHADRLRWLEIDYAAAAEAAEYCGMHTTSLLFVEISTSIIPAKTSRRSTASAILPVVSDQTILDIFRNIDDPDSFYGVPQPPSLEVVLDRFDREGEGFKALMWRGARLDSQMRRHNDVASRDDAGLITSLVNMNMNSLTHRLLAGRDAPSSVPKAADSTLLTKMRLEQWDVRVSETAASDTACIYKVLQTISNSTNYFPASKSIDAGLHSSFTKVLAAGDDPRKLRTSLYTLGILSEVDDMITSKSLDQLQDAVDNINTRQDDLSSISSEALRPILLSHESLMSTLCVNSPLRDSMHLDLHGVRNLQLDTLLRSYRLWLDRQDAQQLLATATYLYDLVPAYAEIGMDIRAVAENVVSDVLWMQGDFSTSVQWLQKIVASSPSDYVSNETHRAALLAKLGHHVGAARLEQPDHIMQNYLVPAIKELKDKRDGPVAGKVFHQFAAFCDAQLQSQDNLDDLDRVTKIYSRRKAEIEAMEQDLKRTTSQTEKRSKKHDYAKADKWFKLEAAEYDRLRRVRSSLIRQCLENYLLSLAASDDHDNDVLRFYAIWLENADSESANSAVAQHLNAVPAAKFVRLMNQLSSRLQADESTFQQLLIGLVFRICQDHPHHAMHHITAGSHDPGTKDEASRSRHRAARHIAKRLTTDAKSKDLCKRIFEADRLYHELAGYTDDAIKSGKTFKLDQFQPSKRVQDSIPSRQLPPPTLTIKVRRDGDYSSVPYVTGFDRVMAVAGGLSAPKIVTSKCSDGTTFKQLFKGGSDDLRQDAIMEQVFEEVSTLLAKHTSTRQRKLRIRTYNVLPLSNKSGVIQFVQNTRALQDVLLPLHTSYHPKDLASNACRAEIANVSKHSNDQRLKTYKDVCKRFQPAMRYFFFERFPEPDVWFERRLAYTRSTAAISILGHIIGLGDRHLLNILLDNVSGEVVHIDLGVCFEAGRVLPLPELVPFRLTRDLVDGMGYTRTEGVFKRCCEFTLEALREERESIMILLNVLRYDPLYSWTVSATKAKKLQEADDVPDRAIDEQTSKRADDDMGEAGRALAVVEKKLGKTLSKEAMVSELITQATDERNLALLFAGWSAWV